MNLLWAVLILAAVETVAVGAMLFVRRTAPEGSYFEDGDRASGVFGVLSTGFAIFAGFVIFLATELRPHVHDGRPPDWESRRQRTMR